MLSPSCRLLAWNNHNLTLDAPLSDVRKRVRRAFQGIDLRDRWLQFTRGKQLHQLVEMLTRPHRVALQERAPKHADDIAAFQERQVQWNAGDLARCKADH